jgi:4'-phosphopantetheinyl transferase
MNGVWLPPPPALELAPGEVHVWQIGLERPPAELADLRQYLNEAERVRAGRYYFERDRNQFAVGRAILRKILGLYLKEDPAGLNFVYGPQGKPALAGETRLEFNLSNSHRTALLAVTTHNPVGVDIEYQKDNISMGELVKRFFAPAEIKTFNNLPASQQREAFFNAWTRKEAYLKACGGGISIGLDRVVVTFVPGEAARIVVIDGSVSEAARWSLAALNPRPGYQAALVVESPGFDLKCWQWPD